MKKTCVTTAAFSVAVVLVAANHLVAAETSAVMLTPADLKWSDVASLPAGAKLALIEGQMGEAGPITARIKFPANYRLPAHWHPGVERVTVLSGTFLYGMGEQADMARTTAFPAGSLIVMPPKMTHFVFTKDETIVQLNVMGPWGITYVNPADDPRKK